MPIQILMPALSPTMTEGNLASGSKKEGESQRRRRHRRDRDRQGDHGGRGGRRGHARQDPGAGGHRGRRGQRRIALLLEEGEDASALEGFEAATAPRRLRLAGSRSEGAGQRRRSRPSAGCSGAARPPRRPAPAAPRAPATARDGAGSSRARSPSAWPRQAGLDLAAAPGQRPARPDRQGGHRAGAQGGRPPRRRPRGRGRRRRAPRRRPRRAGAPVAPPAAAYTSCRSSNMRKVIARAADRSRSRPSRTST